MPQPLSNDTPPLASTTQRLTPIGAIVAAALVANGLLLLNPGVYFDDWMLLDNLNSVSREQMWTLGMTRGIPTDTILWRIFGSLPRFAVTAKMIVFLLIVAIGLLAYRGARLLRLTRTEAVALGCIVVAYPACQTSVLFIGTNGFVYYFLFMLGSVLALSANVEPSSRANLRRVAAALLLYASFGLNSLLVVALGPCLLLLKTDQALVEGRLRSMDSKRLGWLVLRSFYPLALSVAYWTVKQRFLPSSGAYASYNQFSADPGAWFYTAVRFAVNGFVRPVLYSFADGVVHPSILVAALICGLVIARVASAEYRPSSRPLFIAGALGAVMVAFPYVAVGKSPSRFGWDTRYAFLAGLPVAVVLVGCGRLLAARLGRRIVTGILAATVLLFGIRLARTHLELLGRWAMTRAVPATFPRELLDASVVWIYDDIDDARYEQFRWYEWAAILRQIDGREAHLAITVGTVAPDFVAQYAEGLSSTFGLRAWSAKGCHAAVRLSPGPSWGSHFSAGSRFALYRLGLTREVEVKDLVRFERVPLAASDSAAAC